MTAALEVQTPGLHTTLQDLGRFGYQAQGVPVSGALDPESHEIANRLVGNDAAEASLEVLYQGPSFAVAAPSVRIAVAGGDAGIEILGAEPQRLAGPRSLRLTAGERFRVAAAGNSAGCYLAVEGGFAVEPVLGSRSTYARGGFGGFAGRPLKAGDRLPLRRDSVAARDERMVAAPAREPAPIRVVLGPQQDYFTEAAVAALLGAEFTVSKSADRMGLRLDGPALAHARGYNIVSDGIATGAIQVPGSGQPILLLADHQTTGGYPKIATVIAADLPAVGRCRPGDRLRFAAVLVAEAERLRRAQRQALDRALAAMTTARPPGGLDMHRLFDANLISGVVFD